MRVPLIVRWPGRVPRGVATGELATALDLLPTLAAIAGAELPADRTIDGVDISATLFGEEPSAREEFFFYLGNDLEAVRWRRWKLHVARAGIAVTELYDIEDDPSESIDLHEEHPDVVADLSHRVETMREELGDARLGRSGSGTREVGRVAHAVPLTRFDPAHPYYMAEYDLADKG